MAHKHSVYDTDPHFTIDPSTRAIRNQSPLKNTVVQHDHNSERFTFELPRFIDGHDMSLCNVVEVHYLNIDAKTKEQNPGVYRPTDFQVYPEDNQIVVCSWLLSANATKYVGSLNFVLRLACTTGDLIDYAWNTLAYTRMSVSDSINNSEVIVGQYADVLEAWYLELINAGNMGVNMVTEVANRKIEEINKAGEVVHEPGYSKTATVSQFGFTTNIINDKGEIKDGMSVKAYTDIGSFSFYSENVTDLPEDFEPQTYGWLVNITPQLKLLWRAGGNEFYLGNGNTWHRTNYYEPEQELGDSETKHISQKLASKWLRSIVDTLNSGNGNGLNVFTESVGTKQEGFLISASSGEKNTYTSKPGYMVTTYTIDAPFVRIKAQAHWGNYLYSFLGDKWTSIGGEKSDSGSGITSIDKIVEIPQNARYLLVAGIEPTESGIFIGGMRVTPTKKWAGKKWTCVGDSLTEKNSRTTMNYHDYIAEATGITVVNKGVSGTGYKRTDGNGTAFYQRISSVPTDSDVVTIFGSGNDLGAGVELGTPTDTGTNTLCGCINTTIDNLIAIMPTVQLGIVTPTPWVGYNPATENSMKNYANAIVEICKNRSIPCLDLYRCSNLRPWTEEGRSACYTKDDGNGVHPDETGHKIIASRFGAFLDSLIV